MTSTGTLYDAAGAARYWGEERLDGIGTADHDAEDAAVLNQGKPREISAAYAQWETDCLHAMLPDLTGRSVLDLGCGVGRILTWLAPRASEVVGVDVAPGMVARARARVAGFRHVELRVGDMAAVPAPDGHFDQVVCLGVFEHVPAAHRRRALEEIRRVLRPEGELLLELNNAESALLCEAAGDNPHRTGEQFENGYFCELVTAGDVLSVAQEVGLRETDRTANPFYSAVRHAASGDPEEDLPGLFAHARALDARLGRGRAMHRLADQFMVRLVRT
ncbi:class I SAM-dependent methyltransferase [Streptomyces sulphureus]|uniref:class I SAM-dependent methyltransferase n=1 Tax=Streptomyces sulphureus TaxID=47758 RepID=UPI001319D0EB|nr:class I SAM-dependent methyltransferase [Streptomyces sulphureus]